MSFSLPREKKKKIQSYVTCSKVRVQKVMKMSKVQTFTWAQSHKHCSKAPGHQAPHSRVTRPGGIPVAISSVLPKCTAGLGATLSCSAIFHSPTSNRFW